MTITEGIYETRNGTLVGVRAIRPSGLVEGETLAGLATIWTHQGRWLDASRDSEMDLVRRVGEFV